MRPGVIASILLLACSPAAGNINRMADAPRQAVIPASDTSALRGDLYGAGTRGVIIVAHGGRYSSRSNWAPQAQRIADAGFHVLLLETRAAAELAAGREIPCLYDEVCLARDVLAGVRYLRGLGTTSIALIGGSMGGAAVAQAAVEAQPGWIERIVLLAPATIATPERIQGRKLFITTRDDANDAGPRLPGIQAQFDRASEPKRLIVLDGSAHAHRIFLTSHGDAVMRDILAFLRAP